MSVRKARSLVKVHGNGKVVSMDFEKRDIME